MKVKSFEIVTDYFIDQTLTSGKYRIKSNI